MIYKIYEIIKLNLYNAYLVFIPASNTTGLTFYRDPEQPTDITNPIDLGWDFVSVSQAFTTDLSTNISTREGVLLITGGNAVKQPINGESYNLLSNKGYLMFFTTRPQDQEITALFGPINNN